MVLPKLNQFFCVDLMTHKDFGKLFEFFYDVVPLFQNHFLKNYALCNTVRLWLVVQSWLANALALIYHNLIHPRQLKFYLVQAEKRHHLRLLLAVVLQTSLFLQGNIFLSQSHLIMAHFLLLHSSLLSSLIFNGIALLVQRSMAFYFTRTDMMQLRFNLATVFGCIRTARI